MKDVNSEMQESFQNLMKYNSALNNQCNGIIERANAEIAHTQANLQNTLMGIKEAEADNVVLNSQINAMENELQQNQLQAQKFKSEMVEDAKDLQEKALAIVERSRVLRRLLDLVEDDLVGEQRNSTVGNYHVNKTLSGYSFVEVHNQLKEISHSKDPIVKSMMTTLILITRDAGNFANQEIVGKIRNMIESIIKKDQKHGEEMRLEAHQKQNVQQHNLQNIANSSAHTSDSIAEKRAAIVQNNNLIKFSRGQQKGMEVHIKRISERRVSNTAMCKHVQDLSKAEQNQIKIGQNRFAELRKMLDQGH